MKEDYMEKNNVEIVNDRVCLLNMGTGAVRHQWLLKQIQVVLIPIHVLWTLFYKPMLTLLRMIMPDSKTLNIVIHGHT